MSDGGGSIRWWLKAIADELENTRAEIDGDARRVFEEMFGKPASAKPLETTAWMSVLAHVLRKVADR